MHANRHFSWNPVAGLEIAAGALAVTAFAYFLARDAWILAAGMLGGLVLCVGAMYQRRAMLLTLLLGIPSVFVPIDGFIKASGIPMLTVDRALTGFLVGILVLGTLLGRKRIRPLDALEKRMLVLLAVVVVSFATTVPRKSPAHLYQSVAIMFEGYLIPFAGYLLARSFAWSDRQVRLLLWLLAILGVYQAVVGVLQYFFSFLYLTPVFLQVGEKTGRATGGFFSPLEYGQVLGSLILICLLLFASSKDRMARAAVLLMAVAAVGGLILCLTRGQWLAAALALVFVFRKDRRIRTVLFTGGIVGAIVGAFALVALGQLDKIEKRVEDISPIYNRLALWSTAGNMFLNNPVLGVGFGYRTFNDAKRENLVSFGPSALGKYALEPGVPHNEFLHILATMGIIGFIAYVRVYLQVYRTARSCEQDGGRIGQTRAELAMYVQAILVIFVVSGMFAEMHYFKYFLTLLFFLVGVLLSPRPETEPDARGAADA